MGKRRLQYRIFVLLLMTFMGLNGLYGAAGLPENFVVLPNCPFVVCSEVDDTTELVLDDSQFNRMASSLVFRVNRTEIDRNQPFFEQFNDSVIAWLKHEHFQIEKLFIRGAASPEGPYANNKRLGIGRTQNLFSLIEHQLYIPNAPMPRLESQSIIEDYRYLVDLMTLANDEETDTVRSLFEACDWNEPRCKMALRMLHGGKTWNRLLQEYFPRLRSARVVIWVKRYTLPSEQTLRSNFEALPLVGPSPRSILDSSMVTLPGWKTFRRPLVAIRTNLVRDLFYMPKFGWAPTLDVQLEWYPLYGHYTANMGFSWSNWRKWDQHKFFQIRDAQLEVRRYFRGGGEFWGPYIGLYLEGLVYGVGFNADEGWQGEGWGAGLDFGYVLRLTKSGHFRMEFALSIGYLGTVYDEYVFGNPVTKEYDGLYYYNYTGAAEKFRRRNTMLTWVGPTNLSIALTYDIIYRTRNRHASRQNGTYDWYTRPVNRPLDQ